MYDNKKDLFVWIGKGASKEEQHNALTYAHVSFIYVDIFICFFFSIPLLLILHSGH